MISAAFLYSDKEVNVIQKNNQRNWKTIIGNFACSGDTDRFSHSSRHAYFSQPHLPAFWLVHIPRAGSAKRSSNKCQKLFTKNLLRHSTLTFRILFRTSHCSSFLQVTMRWNLQAQHSREISSAPVIKKKSLPFFLQSLEVCLLNA